MNQIPLYQHPFVDVFKQLKLTDWKLAHKEGDVTDVYDKELAKNVIKVSGTSSASNYFQLPGSKHLPKKALGLIGKYVYAVLNVPPGKTFVVHFDYTVNETRLVRVSLSNIYKEFKNMNGSSIQIPVNIQHSKWTMVAINGHQILEENQVFQGGQKHSYFMRSLQVSSNVQVRGIFTSDIKYSVPTLPKDMALKLTKSKDWYEQYAWFEYPSEQQESQQKYEKENVTTNIKEQKASKKRSTSILKNPTSSKNKSTKNVKFTNKDESKQSQDIQDINPNKESEFQDVELQQDTNQPNDTQVETDDVDSKERTVKQIEELKTTHNFNLEPQTIQSQAEMLLYQQENNLPFNQTKSRAISSSQNEKFVLKPNPIMRLERVIGMHPRYQAAQIFYNKDAKLSRELLYSQANLLLGYQSRQQKQRLFYDHPTQSIQLLQVEPSYAFTASKPQKEESKDFEISIWSIEDCECIFTFKPPLISIHSITLSTDQEHLCLSGKDFQKRDLILVYFFKELVKFKKVELYARQLSDFDIASIRFNDILPNSLISCGKENIRFFKIKNNHLPSQSVILNNMGRGKTFNRSVVDFTQGEKGKKKPSFVFVTTHCGLLYFVNYNTRQIDKVVQIHEDKITSLVLSPERDFCVTTALNGILRIWSPDFNKLISEVNTQGPILDCDVNVSQKEIAVLNSQGQIAILDLDSSSYNIIMRSHQENISDVSYNQQTQKLVSIGLDQSVKVWKASTMDVEEEFTTENDTPTRIATNQADSMVAIGFKSGFVRVFDLQQNKLHFETMIFESPIMDIQYSQDNRFLALFFKSSKIVIFNVEKGYQPVKTIDYDFPNNNYFSLAFSSDGKYLANISSNANTVTIWETKNFSLKFHLDLTGEVISKIKFAPSGKDFIVLTTSSKLKFYRVGFSELQFIKDAYGLTDMECLDFEVTANNKYIICAGKEGVIKVYDYFMRGEAVASSQAFLGHNKFPYRVCCQDDLKYIFSVGEGNGIFKWSFYGDREMPPEINQYFEKLDESKIGSSKLQQVPKEPMFKDEELQSYTQQQIQQLQDQLSYQELHQGYEDPYQTRQTDPMTSVNNRQTFDKSQQQQLMGLSHQPLIEYNNGGYRFEQYEMQLKKVLACSTAGVKNNIVWNKQHRYIAYSSQNIVIVEDLNQEKTQRLLKEGNDKIYQMKMSPNQKMILAFTKHGQYEGFPCIFIWDAVTLKKLNQMAVNDQEIMAVEFSPNSNMLLVISRNTDGENSTSCVAVWDFLDGHKDILCKSHLPMTVSDGKWNPFFSDANEFVTLCDRKYHYWKISNSLTLQYQEGDIPKKTDAFGNKEASFSTLEFVAPTAEQISVYLLIGLNTGYVWVLDSRSNQYLYNVKVLDSSIRSIFTYSSKITIEGDRDTVLHCWPQGGADFDKSDPNCFFYNKEANLTLDGFPVATSYDEIGGECFVSTSSGSIWFLSWVENATIKLKSCHSPIHQIRCFDYKYVPPGQFQVQEEADQFMQFDQNYMVASSGEDGIIKLWNMFDFEFILQFIVPKEECVTMAMHQFKPYMIGSFTDGFLRFFEINKSKNLGRCQIYHDQEKNTTDYMISLKILPSGNHVLGASKNGQIILIYVQQWDPLAIKIETLASINTQIHAFDVSFLEPYNKWLVGTSNGKVIVYNRKDFNAFQQEIFNEENPPKFNFMDSFNMLDYVDNNFTESKRSNTLDHYYSISKRNLVFNDVQPENDCEGLFANHDLAIYIAFIKKCNFIFVRNFELHQVVKRIQLDYLPVQMSLTPNSPFFVVLQQDSTMKMIDLVNEENTNEIKTIHEESKLLKVCPNGRYILTGGDKGDVCIWSISKLREVNPATYE